MSLKDVLLNMLYPRGIKCVVCGKELFDENRYGICSGCLQKANIRFCPKCGRAIGSTSVYCDDCTKYKRNYNCARAPFIFDGDAKRIVYGLKYGGKRYLAKTIAQFLADEYYKANWYIDFITYVPMHVKRQKSRGYNQAQLIAIELAKIINKPVVDALVRTKYSTNFARLTKKERIKQAENSYESTGRFAKKSVLLIDDVFTTGTTVGACSSVLQKSGTSDIYVLTFCTGVCKPELF